MPRTVAFTTAAGATITLEAWGRKRLIARILDFRNFYAHFAAYLRAQEAGHPPDENIENLIELLADRVIGSAVPDENERALIEAADMPDLLDALDELNRIRDLLGNVERREAEHTAMQTLTPTPPA